MTTDELLKALARECPNGVSFDPMAVRLLRQKVTFEEGQVEELKHQMFRLGNKLWFSSEMISDNEVRLAVREQATKWLTEYGCFSVERLFESYCGILRHIATTECLATFLRHLGFSVAMWGKCGWVCFQPPSNLGECLGAISKTIAERIEEADGTLTFNKLEEAMPHLNAEALENIREQFLPEVHEVEIGEFRCWQREDAISLPADFVKNLTSIVDTLVDLGEKVSKKNLVFALNLFYRSRFREEYGLLDDDTFMCLCAKNYRGENSVFPSLKKQLEAEDRVFVSPKRVRSPNTKFANLGVPIGAELVFLKKDGTVCTVWDDSNQVKYDGKSWAISALTNHLLKASGVNGFCYFCYEGETLWNRRLRLEQEHQ